MSWKEKLLYANNWNIGIAEQTPEMVVSNKKVINVKWMKHPFKDRWFADPFIINITDNEIVLFVEECSINNPKGILCELIINKTTMRLKQRYVILELETHLSYPAFIRQDNKLYVYPENGALGKLNIYEYNSQEHRLVNPACILKEAVADATILKQGESFFLFATKVPNTQSCVYLYKSVSLFGPFQLVNNEPFQSLCNCSRPGGNCFIVNDQLFRPAQNCKERYGASLSIMRINEIGDTVNEHLEFKISPLNNKYNLGIHTINFSRNLCVVDGCGYRYPLFGKIYSALSKAKRNIL